MTEPRITVADLEFFYDAMRGPELANYKTYKSNVRRLLPFFGEKAPGDIGPAECREYADERRIEGAGDGTIRREFATLSAICHYGAKHRQISKADLPIIDRPPNPPSKDRWLREGELCTLMDTAKTMRKDERLSRLERFLWIAIMTAARFTAVFELEWPQVDWDTGMIHFNPEGRKQTKKRRASVSMSEELKIVMRQAYNERVSDYVLDNKRDLRGEINRCIAKSGLEKVTPHTLRHTAATHMARRGVPMWQIAGVLGVTEAVASKTYAHHCPKDTAEAVRNIPSPVNQTVH